MSTEPDKFISLKEAKIMLKNKRRMSNVKFSKSFFIPMSVIQKIAGVPGVGGVNIYNGLIGNVEKLVVVPAVNNDDHYEDILHYAYSINNEEAKELTNFFYAAKGPHPPPPKNTARYFNELNSDEVE